MGIFDWLGITKEPDTKAIGTVSPLYNPQKDKIVRQLADEILEQKLQITAEQKAANPGVPPSMIPSFVCKVMTDRVENTVSPHEGELRDLGYDIPNIVATVKSKLCAQAGGNRRRKTRSRQPKQSKSRRRRS